TNSWTHWALTFDGSSVRVYINGAVTRTLTGLSGTITPTTGPFRIGSRSANQIYAARNDRFNGLIDEVSVYNRALSDGEIQAIYLAGDAGKCPPENGCTLLPPGLVSWWQGQGNPLDQTGANNGTLVGNTSYGAAEVGQGFVFDGSGDAVVVGNPASLQLQN